jgi:hypothetical protein
MSTPDELAQTWRMSPIPVNTDDLRYGGYWLQRRGGMVGDTIAAMDKPRCRHPNRLQRLIAFLRRRCEQTLPTSWLDEPPADPDIGVREPRRPRPSGGAGIVLLKPPL